MTKKPRHKDPKTQRNQQDKVADLNAARDKAAQQRVAEVVKRTDERVQMIEKLASRLAVVAPELIISLYPSQGKGLDMQLVTAGLVTAAGRLMSQYCPEEHRPEAAALLVDWLGRAVVGDEVMEQAQASIPNQDSEPESEAARIITP